MSEEKKSSTLRLRGLPFNAEEADIREFLGDGFDITNVYITKKNSEYLILGRILYFLNLQLIDPNACGDQIATVVKRMSGSQIRRWLQRRGRKRIKKLWARATSSKPKCKLCCVLLIGETYADSCLCCGRGRYLMRRP